jgi:hypothetical protein
MHRCGFQPKFGIKLPIALRYIILTYERIVADQIYVEFALDLRSYTPSEKISSIGHYLQKGQFLIAIPILNYFLPLDLSSFIVRLLYLIFLKAMQLENFRMLRGT